MIPLTPAQQTEVDKLVAQGWDRDAADLMVAESEPDIVDDATPAPEGE